MGGHSAGQPRQDGRNHLHRPHRGSRDRHGHGRPFHSGADRAAHTQAQKDRGYRVDATLRRLPQADIGHSAAHGSGAAPGSPSTAERTGSSSATVWHGYVSSWRCSSP